MEPIELFGVSVSPVILIIAVVVVLVVAVGIPMFKGYKQEIAACEKTLKAASVYDASFEDQKAELQNKLNYSAAGNTAPSTSMRKSDPDGMGSAISTTSRSPSAVATPSMGMRVSPSRTVTFVVDPSKLPPSGSSSVTDATSSLSPTVPSHVSRVGRPPMTALPPSSFERAVALFVVRAYAGADRASEMSSTTPKTSARSARPVAAAWFAMRGMLTSFVMTRRRTTCS